MTKSYFFWGVYEGNEMDETWKTLHDYFEKLAGENGGKTKEIVVTERKAVLGKEGVRD